MKSEDREFIREKVTEMLEAPSCCEDAKKAGQAWLDSDGELEATKALLETLFEVVTPIDDLIAMASSDAGKEYFGAEKAAQIAAHAKEIKDQGELYCDCAACAPAKAILERRTELVG